MKKKGSQKNFLKKFENVPEKTVKLLKPSEPF